VSLIIKQKENRKETRKKLMIMKTIKLLSTAVLVAIVAIATAVEKPKMDVVPLNADRAVISVENTNAAIFELSIYAENGDLVYFKETSKPESNYKKVFDFKNLENGNYTMNVKVNDTRVVKNFTVSTKGINVGESELRFDPYFSYTNDELKLTYLNFDKENLSLNIYGEDGLVYEKAIGSDFNVISGYDLSALNSGKYEVVLSSANNNYKFDIEK
jgi:hypothetical protein